MPNMVKGWNRGLVDGDYTQDDAEAWQAWAEGLVDAHPEATLLQLIAITRNGGFEADYLANNEGGE